MQIDRRDLLTGLAATVAAARLPAFAEASTFAKASVDTSAGRPALPVKAGVRRFVFLDGPIFPSPTPWVDEVFPVTFDRWHFDPNPKGLPLIRHEGSGLTLRRDPQEDDQFQLKAVFIEDPLEGWPDAERIAFVGRSALLPALHGAYLRFLGDHAGAIYFRYKLRNFNDPLTEDAPALA
jgi:hypothetical protein